jgi:hypothetical protein
MNHPEIIGDHAVVKERRIDGKVRIVQIAAVLCALFAAIGIAHGMHDANPRGGWTVPAIAGVVAATAFAAFWHVAIGTVIGMVRRTTLVALFAGAIVMTGVALGASAQAIATAVAGRSALATELSLLVDSYGKALAEAYGQATGWRGVADAANVLAHGLSAQAETETTGGNGTGKGCGPRCSSLKDASASFGQAAAALQGMLDEATQERDAGENALGDLRIAAATGDQAAFMAAAESVSQTIGKLNAVDPKPIIDNTGMVVGSAKGINLSQETSDFRDKANAALAGRHAVEAPVFLPMSLGEATRKQALGSALHGWILAGAIDVLPLMFLALIFVMSREVWLQENVERRSLTPEGRNARDRQALADLQQGNGNNVVRLQAAE